jgi:glutamyl-tRNA reductase
MTFYAFGVNHLQAPVAVREAFALDEEGKRAMLRRLELGSSSELLLLSTCNRTEAYLYGTEEDVAPVRRALAEAAGSSWPEAESFYFQDEAAVRHVLEVAAGLKSLVLGDAQIFSQLKEAYRIAVEEQRVDTTMHRLLHTAFRTAKRVINETDLASGAASIPCRAVEATKGLYGSRFGKPLEALSALIVGSGSMGRLAAHALRLERIGSLAFTNRSPNRGLEAAERHRAAFVPWKDRHVAAARADIVIVATSAELPVLHVDAFQKHEVGDHVVIVDISVPRNVEAGIGRIPGVLVIDVDQLIQEEEGEQDPRASAVPAARAVVDEMHAEFVAWVFHHQALQPAIRAIAETFETIRAQEVNRHHQRFSEADRAELDRITRSIIQKLLAVPIVRLKSVEPESIDFVRGIRLLHALFLRQECTDAEMPAAPARSDSGNEPREDCPIEPQLPVGRPALPDAGLDLDAVLRLFVAPDADRSS